MTEIPVLLLAAGGSARMGKPKQLLPWGDITLIEHQIRTLTETGSPVSVVLGFSSDKVIPLIEKYPVHFVVNNEWENGMGSSVSTGILHIIQQFPHADGVLICLLDQPLLTTAYIKKMIYTWEPGFKQILASHSESGWTGVPVIFDKCYFEELSKLSNDEGAKKVIKRYENNIILLDAGDIVEDIDTPQSYQYLLNKYIAQPGN